MFFESTDQKKTRINLGDGIIHYKSQCKLHVFPPPAVGCRITCSSTWRWWHLLFWSCCATSLCSSWFWFRSDAWGPISPQQRSAALSRTWGPWPVSLSCWAWHGQWGCFPLDRLKWSWCTCSPSSTLFMVNMSCSWFQIQWKRVYNIICIVYYNVFVFMHIQYSCWFGNMVLHIFAFKKFSILLEGCNHEIFDRRMYSNIFCTKTMASKK